MIFLEKLEFPVNHFIFGFLLKLMIIKLKKLDNLIKYYILGY